MTKICGHCRHFHIADPDDATKLIPQAAYGIGRCHGFDGHVSPVEPYVRWDAKFCVAYDKAQDIDKRKQWIKTQQGEE